MIYVPISRLHGVANGHVQADKTQNKPITPPRIYPESGQQLATASISRTLHTEKKKVLPSRKGRQPNCGCGSN